MFVLGIDPGLTRCGYGVIERLSPRRTRAVAAGVLRTDPDAELPDRLAELQAEVRGLLHDYRPDAVAIERVLFQVNVRTAMQVGQAAGVVMAEAAATGCRVALYSPNEVKSAVAGWGGADKRQMEQMVRAQLDIEQALRPVDAADAVAVALCHLAIAPMADAVARGGST
ncbi:MAG: crossover junction endodeoxyribonuclease RuvC [Actinobacteria bacterium]|nr:crossover junction endodeoxyribonuclease RuvC [Actinomycetota bacterium]